MVNFILMVLGMNVGLNCGLVKRDLGLKQKLNSIFIYNNYIDNPYVSQCPNHRSLTVEEVMREEKVAVGTVKTTDRYRVVIKEING